jgi:hypothetical protein
MMNIGVRKLTHNVRGQRNTANLLESNQYGTKYSVEYEITYQNKTATLKSAWMVRHNEDFARLITCYILRG